MESDRLHRLRVTGPEGARAVFASVSDSGWVRLEASPSPPGCVGIGRRSVTRPTPADTARSEPSYKPLAWACGAAPQRVAVGLLTARPTPWRMTGNPLTGATWSVHGACRGSGGRPCSGSW